MDHLLKRDVTRASDRSDDGRGDSDCNRVRPAAAQRPCNGRGTEYDDGCFHCQQAVEKYLKGLLTERGVAFPMTHDLVRVLALLLPSDPSLQPLRAACSRLSSYAVRLRYPRTHADRRRPTAAFKTVELARAEVRRCLGLRARP